MVRDAKLESGSSQQPPAFICQLGVKVNGRTPLICGFETTSFEALLLHEGIVHLKTLHPCLKCNLRFGSRLEFRRHCRRCPHNQQCNFCPQRFPTQASLTYHCLQRHPSLYIKPLPNSQDPRRNCRFCSKQFSNYHNRLQHERRLHNKSFEETKVSPPARNNTREQDTTGPGAAASSGDTSSEIQRTRLRDQHAQGNLIPLESSAANSLETGQFLLDQVCPRCTFTVTKDGAAMQHHLQHCTGHSSKQSVLSSLEQCTCYRCNRVIHDQDFARHLCDCRNGPYPIPSGNEQPYHGPYLPVAGPPPPTTTTATAATEGSATTASTTASTAGAAEATPAAAASP